MTPGEHHGLLEPRAILPRVPGMELLTLNSMPTPQCSPIKVLFPMSAVGAPKPAVALGACRSSQVGMLRYVSQDLGVELELVSSLFVQVWSLSVLLRLPS